jgi:adenylate kinase
MLAERLGIPHVSTGDLLRAEVADETALGRKAKAAMDAGHLVPDSLVLDVLAARLARPDARAHGYLLDGFPRTLAQAQALFGALGPGAADVAIEIHCSNEHVLPRLAARRVCSDCGTTTTLCPEGARERPCNVCGGELVRRDDDTDEAIRRRLAIYDEESVPLLTWLDSRDLLHSVDGTGSPGAVHDRVMAAVRSRIPSVDPIRARGLVAG